MGLDGLDPGVGSQARRHEFSFWGGSLGRSGVISAAGTPENGPQMSWATIPRSNPDGAILQVASQMDRKTAQGTVSRVVSSFTLGRHLQFPYNGLTEAR